ncbi:MAG: prepilin-type N-terminal cleavage/methylation domain-containing protein [Candidatus Gracilibacteria bacterium]
MKKSIFKNKLSRKYGFTLVELIIVITILAILSTIGYISYSSYISQSRDSIRLSQVSNIISAMETYRIKGSIPIPGDKVTVYASGEIIGYQGYASANILSMIGYEEGGKDPLSGEYFTYFVNLKQRKRSILVLLENGIDTNNNTIDERMPVSYGDKVGIILDTNNQPIQDNIDLKATGLDIKTTTETYNVYFSDTDNISGTGELLQVLYGTATTGIIGETCEDYIKENAGYFLTPGYYLLNLGGSLEKTYCDMVLGYCMGSIPELAVSNALSKNGGVWTYNINPGECTYTCDTNYTWNGTTCEANTQIYTCTAKPATGTVWNTVDHYTQTWNGTSWLPANTTIAYNTTGSTTECNYICDTNYTWDGSTCVANTQTYTCLAKPVTGTVWNTVDHYTQTWNGTAWLPAVTTTAYNTTGSTSACNYTCDTGYTWNGTTCVVLDPLASCTGTGQLVTASSTYPGVSVSGLQPIHPACDTQDVIVCSGSGTGYTLSSCNIGAAIAGTGSSSYGYYFQWGRNKGFIYGDLSHLSATINGTVGLNAGTDSYGFVRNSTLPLPYTWANTDITNNWGDTTNTNIARQGACATGYHIPSKPEWLAILTAGGWGTNGTNMMNALKLPKSGGRSWDTGAMYNQGVYGTYWLSTPSTYAYGFNFSTGITPSLEYYRAPGFTIRCTKN